MDITLQDMLTAQQLEATRGRDRIRPALHDALDALFAAASRLLAYVPEGEQGEAFREAIESTRVRVRKVRRFLDCGLDAEQDAIGPLASIVDVMLGHIAATSETALHVTDTLGPLASAVDVQIGRLCSYQEMITIISQAQKRASGEPKAA